MPEISDVRSAISAPSSITTSLSATQDEPTTDVIADRHGANDVSVAAGASVVDDELATDRGPVTNGDQVNGAGVDIGNQASLPTLAPKRRK